jgi:outer membrane protein OmpA-like peptidoglycan-associated protein
MKLVFALLVISTAAYCQTVQPLKSASVNDLVEKLAPLNEEPKTRSLGSRNLAPSQKSIDLVIQFDLDSAKLKEPSKPLLDNLAAAMKNDRLAGVKFKVEGHTDAQGSEQHNLKLSLSRAETVLSYLSAQGVEQERLSGEGKGFSELLIPEKPKAAENRRVRITTQP